MKPDDIPEDVWESAIRCAEVVCRNLPENYGDMTIEIRAIARAILAERARCAKMVTRAADEQRALQSVRQGGGPEFRAKMLANLAAALSKPNAVNGGTE